ncbi:MAG TPA: hypothetical protein VHU40_09810, partial [Polyangia bacterium]|nr:hypothetical protein [Polyangia bacterium]
FTIPGVPDTKANLKVWAGGRWAYEQQVDTSSKADLAIRVTSSKAAKDTETKEADEAREADPKGSAE